MAIVWVKLSSILSVDEAIELVDGIMKSLVIDFSLDSHVLFHCLLLPNPLFFLEDFVLLVHLVSVSNIDAASLSEFCRVKLLGVKVDSADLLAISEIP